MSNDRINSRKKFLSDHGINDGLLRDLVARGLWRMVGQSIDDAITERQREIVALCDFREEINGDFADNREEFCREKS